MFFQKSKSAATSDGAAPFIFSGTGPIQSAEVINQLKAVSSFILDLKPIRAEKHWAKTQLKMRMQSMNPDHERKTHKELEALFLNVSL